ncbi:MAG: DUF3179 domain-containing protein, partial [Chloroflexi bacterium]|nr:DUF3179 domain-containing protein [Chloroflexota bacterium]
CSLISATVSPRATPTRSQFANAASRECANPVPEDRQFPLPPWPNTNFCRHSVPYDEFLYGGRGRDSIPALNNPELETIAEAELWLTDREPVLVLQLGDEARAYPIPILIWHEIVNDEVAGQPVVVTYCPLCNSGLAFARALDGQTLEFGVTGILRNADLIMFDRQTESWWQQFTGEAVVGEMTGTKLTPLPVSLVSFADFKTQFPNGRIRAISRYAVNLAQRQRVFLVRLVCLSAGYAGLWNHGGCGLKGLARILSAYTSIRCIITIRQCGEWRKNEFWAAIR